jgi:NAD-dependent aldehyde dehydrogenases
MNETDTNAAESVLAETAWTSRRLDRLTARIAESTTSDTEATPVTAPTVDQTIGAVPALSAADVESAAARTRSPAADWRATPIAERAAVVERFANLVAQNQAELLDLVQLETGKSRIDAFEEVIEVPESADYYAGTAAEILATEARDSGLPL